MAKLCCVKNTIFAEKEAGDDINVNQSADTMSINARARKKKNKQQCL